ncbi:hypothetical protein [Actinoallomurus rhizosphaericola]|uniref:hypothetical protein n=1 Tax=Actinoallomurus rhizosphaericola TaxID=2952536 RepID=UPI00209000EE|nr:hypothetical protein [Actinoallomurus rhizosphaericola]MCO5993889.1 hypothetical protein [Actinoallomurus rhizosphaericola]
MARILVTVGMGPWPFDRLIGAIAPLCSDHEVFAQTGTSSLRPPCPHEPFLPADELGKRMDEADVIITHAGNTVRLVQRSGRVPIAVARTSALGEMGNDHQVAYLRQEERFGPVVAVWDVRDLPREVARHGERQAWLLKERPLPPAATPEHIVEVMTSLSARLCGDAHDR